jgi:hypothetical protein
MTCIAEQQPHLDEREEFQKCERLMNSILSAMAAERADISTSYHALLLVLTRVLESIQCPHCRKMAAEAASQWLAIADSVAPRVVH